MAAREPTSPYQSSPASIYKLFPTAIAMRFVSTRSSRSRGISVKPTTLPEPSIDVSRCETGLNGCSCAGIRVLSAKLFAQDLMHLDTCRGSSQHREYVLRIIVRKSRGRLDQAAIQMQHQQADEQPNDQHFGHPELILQSRQLTTKLCLKDTPTSEGG